MRQERKTARAMVRENYSIKLFIAYLGLIKGPV